MTPVAQISPGHRSERLVESRLTILQWNVWWRFGKRWRERQPLIVDVLRNINADVVTLQEVWGAEGKCQAEEIASALGFSWAYDAASQIDGQGFGNAVLSWWPITTQRSLLLPSIPSAGGSRDCRALYACVDGPRGSIDVCCTHLSYRPEESGIRQRQVGAICQFVAELPGGGFPPVVCGDFNAVPGSDEIRQMTGKMRPPVEGMVFYDAWEAAGAVDPGFTWDNGNPNAVTALEPNRRLDYVFVGRPAGNGAGHVLSARLEGRESVDGLCPSDHYALVVELRY
jgi:endonuclease/exonuclease/phosphatase family metal-dependent hydrolase